MMLGVLLALTCPVHMEKSPWLPRLHIYVLMVPSPYIVPPPMNLDSRISTSNSTQTMPKSYLPHGEKITLFSLWVGPLSYWYPRTRKKPKLSSISFRFQWITKTWWFSLRHVSRLWYLKSIPFFTKRKHFINKGPSHWFPFFQSLLM